MAKNKVQGKKERLIEENLDKGIEYVKEHSLFGDLRGNLIPCGSDFIGKHSIARVEKRGLILLNKTLLLQPKEWAYVIAHCQLHLALGHFDAEKMPGVEILREDGSREWKVTADKYLWNMACDIYIAKFLEDMKFGKSILDVSTNVIEGNLSDEREIYQALEERGVTKEKNPFGMADTFMDMIGLDKPLTYDKKKKEQNRFISAFAEALAYSAANAVSLSGGHEEIYYYHYTKAEKAKEWFVNHYPLLGSLASAFKVIESSSQCSQKEISIAAIDVERGEIYYNPAAGLSSEELRFVMAHELLHAGLMHHERCQGRDFDLWNAACDYVINGWLHDMHVGKMPEQGLLYDESYKGWSAESIYEEIIKNLRKGKKLNTFRGYGKGDILGRNSRKHTSIAGGISLDEFCKSALSQGLEYHISNSRGYLPAGLIEEIRALCMPPIPWDVELGQWFDGFFAPLEKRHTYARPSRRQGATPDIPRPRYVKTELAEDSRTFGVVVDTSGSMNTKLLGMALGSIASYAAAKEVPYARVVFCDADAYDAGYLMPEDIAGRVAVKGRGGTKLQPGIDLLESAKDFPKDGPILIITDGEIENKLTIHHEHAFLIPRGKRLPFKARGKVFYFTE